MTISPDNMTDENVLLGAGAAGSDAEGDVFPVPVMGNTSYGALTGYNTSYNDTGGANSTWLTTTSAPSSGGKTGPYMELWKAIIITIILGFIIIGTILGNVLVCTAVAIVRKLRTPSNLLIVSLAVSDLLVALLVMPFAAMYEVMGRWMLGDRFCDAWTSLDVMLCTASILNLCMISVDRYFVITRPFQYAVKRTPKNMALMITGVWLTSALITLPPLFGWKSAPVAGQCSVSQDIGYQFYATIGAFYLPVTVMIVIYYRIYVVSSRIAASEAKSKPGLSSDSRLPSEAPSTHTIRKPSAEENHNIHCPNHNGHAGRNKARTCSDESQQEMLPKNKNNKNAKNKNKNKKSNNPSGGGRRKRFNFLRKPNFHRKIGSGKESKATKTLGVIMGAFTACWLPFFILALIKPFCDNCVPMWINSIFLWLGYCNSFLNPIIYARFNRDFRTPFKEILCFRCRGINVRLRSESYVEQYGAAPGPATLRDCIRPPVDTVVRYHSQGQTIVKLGNGEAACEGGGNPGGGVNRVGTGSGAGGADKVNNEAKL